MSSLPVLERQRQVDAAAAELTPDEPEKCSSTAKHAKDAKKLHEFKPLIWKNWVEAAERLRSGGSRIPMRTGESLRSLRPRR